MDAEPVLRITADGSLDLPLQAVTETFGILAVKRAGKSNAAVALAEEMYYAGLRWVAVDPKGDWYGVRAAGTGPGLEVVVFGGQHGDVPLEPTAGRLIADLVVGQRLTCVLDVSEMTKADQRRFLFDFADRLYRTNTEPLHVFCEEADEYIPQMVRGESARVVAAFETLVKRGGFRGIGITLITQRSASLNKDVLTQVGTLFVLRTTSPQDQKAILDWIRYHAAAAETIAQLPGLGAGEAFVYSPAWLDTPLQRITFRRRSTFDSGATPQAGVERRQPTVLADVDLATIKEAMAATIEKAEAQDPRKLQARVRELERQLAGEMPPPELQQAQRRIGRLEGALAGVRYALTDLAGRAQEVADLIAGDVGEEPPAAAKEGEAIQPGPSAAGSASDRPANGSRRVPPPPRGREAGRAAGDAPSGPDRSQLGKAERSILQVLAMYGDRAKTQVAVITGYSHKGGGFRNALSRLRTAGLIEGTERLTITSAGRDALGPVEPLPGGAELREHWQAQLGRAERVILDELARVFPQAVSRDALATATGYSAEGGGFRNALGKLRGLELIHGRNELTISQELTDVPF